MKKFKKILLVTVTAFFVFAVLGITGPSAALAAGPAAVNLGTAGNYTILSKTAITTTGVTSITGDIGISPAFASALTGFGLVLDTTGCFSTTVPTTLVTGKVYAADYSTLGCTTPAILTTAVSNMETAYTDAATRTPGTGATNLNVGGGTLSGQNFVPGTYTWNTPGNVTITGDIILSGGANDVWIFQITGTLGIEAGKKIILAGGAQAANIFWQVAGTTTLKPGSTFEGNILAGPGTSTIAMQNGAILHGRALGQKDVTLIGNNVSAPTASAPPAEGKANLHVEKLVVNANGGTAVASDFTIHVKLFGTDVAGSPALGVTPPGTLYSLSPNTYIVGEDANASYTQSFSGDCNSSGRVRLFEGDNKTCTITNTSKRPSGEIRGIKFEDINGNGSLKDCDRHGIAGWTIYIDVDNDGVLDSGEPTSITDRRGNYRFLNLTAGTYIIREVGKSGWTQTYPSSGLYSIVLTTRQISKNNNFGNFKNGSISGMKFNDLNGNHRKGGSGEVGMSGWTIYLDTNNNGVLDGSEPSTLTNANGSYSFTNLLSGIYRVREVQQPDWVQTTSNPASINVHSGTVSKNNNFGNHFGPVSYR